MKEAGASLFVFPGNLGEGKPVNAPPLAFLRGYVRGASLGRPGNNLVPVVCFIDCSSHDHPQDRTVAFVIVEFYW